MRLSSKYLALLLTISAQSQADDHFKIAKVFAGQFGTMQQFIDAVERNTRERAPVPDHHVIDCKRGQRFGVGYVVFIKGTAPVNFEMTWEYSHLADSEGKARDVRDITVRKPTTHTYDLKSAIRVLEEKQLVEGDFVISLHRHERLLLQHVFHVRGCESD